MFNWIQEWDDERRRNALPASRTEYRAVKELEARTGHRVRGGEHVQWKVHWPELTVRFEWT